ncbi:MAG: hypothetical protein B6247_10025 [Candidatus Parabeggiatoa sp. nov. 2]|nr:MAG: hypothetical protein B6247_10025 [Beggiatoa sp. 4572_84]
MAIVQTLVWQEPQAKGVAPFYINIVPKGLTLKPLSAPSVSIIKARGNAPGLNPSKRQEGNLGLLTAKINIGLLPRFIDDSFKILDTCSCFILFYNESL